jgi:hypothetical protein
MGPLGGGAPNVDGGHKAEERAGDDEIRFHSYKVTSLHGEVVAWLQDALRGAGAPVEDFELDTGATVVTVDFRGEGDVKFSDRE